MRYAAKTKRGIVHQQNLQQCVKIPSVVLIEYISAQNHGVYQAIELRYISICQARMS